MNKKGTLIHWIIFGVLAALGLFIASTTNINLKTTGIKGEWQLQFLKENYLAAEKEELRLNLLAKELGRTIAQELAFNGGFKTSSDCGIVDGIPLWNFEERWCVVEPDRNVKASFLEKKRSGIPMEMQDIEEVGIDNSGDSDAADNSDDSSVFFGKGVQKTVKGAVGTYTYPITFSISLGYSFTEYTDLQNEARNLVQNCRNKKELLGCLATWAQQTANPRWNLGLCGERLTTVTKRTLPFCVESPRGTVFAGKPLQYQIGLDFTPVEPWVVEEFTVEKKVVGDNGHIRYEIRFEQDPSIDQYRIYYTNWPEVKDRKGTAQEVFESGVSLATLGYFQGKVVFDNPSSGTCPTEKEAHKAYWCDNKIVYVLEDDKITGETYFTVTAVKGSEESKMESWEKIG